VAFIPQFFPTQNIQHPTSVAYMQYLSGCDKEMMKGTLIAKKKKEPILQFLGCHSRDFLQSP
jgi:hypothetical protein